MKKIVILLLIALLSVSIISCGKKENTEIIKKDVEISVSDGILKGKLLTAENETLIIIVPGSGPTSMDGMGNSYKFLSEKLSEKQYDVFRYDKRGVGKSKNIKVVESEIRVEDYTKDIEEIIRYFKKVNKYKKIVLIGHSQGSLFGMLAIENEPVDFFISLAGAGFSIDKVIMMQIKENKLNPEYIITESEEILSSLKKGEKTKKVNPLLNSLFRYDIQDYMISWIKYDPAEEIKKLTNTKVLIIQGDNDVQIDISNAEKLHNTCESSELKIVKDMSHILKIAPPKEDYKEHIESYYDDKSPIADELVQYIVDFIQN